MFGEMKELAKLAGLLKNGPKLQQRFEEVRARVATQTFSAEAGGGAVTAVADGQSRLVSLAVEPVLLASLADPSAPADRALAEGLIVEAVNAALRGAQRMMAEEVALAMNDMDMPFPKEFVQGLLNRSAGG